MGNGRETAGCVTANRRVVITYIDTPTHTLPDRPNSHLPKQPCKGGRAQATSVRPTVLPVASQRQGDLTIASTRHLNLIGQGTLQVPRLGRRVTPTPCEESHLLRHAPLPERRVAAPPTRLGAKQGRVSIRNVRAARRQREPGPAQPFLVDAVGRRARDRQRDPSEARTRSLLPRHDFPLTRDSPTGGVFGSPKSRKTNAEESAQPQDGISTVGFVSRTNARKFLTNE